MILLFIGAQGSGKGTQAKIISKKLNLCHISTGDMLREATGKLKEEIDSYINQGALVPDELILKILKQRIQHPDCKTGIIFDGYPRNLQQTDELAKILKLDKVIEISISDKEAVKRLKGRWNCKKCGIAYNIVTMPKPKQDKICDVCREKLSQRTDDINEEAIKKRLAIYHEETTPILSKYRDRAIKINGEQEIEKITEDILEILK